MTAGDDGGDGDDLFPGDNRGRLPRLVDHLRGRRDLGGPLTGQRTSLTRVWQSVFVWPGPNKAVCFCRATWWCW